MRTIRAAIALTGVAASAAAKGNPETIALAVSNNLARQPFSSAFWDYAYGPSIAIATMYEVSSYWKIDLTRALDRRLNTFLTNSSWPAYKVLNNITMPFDGEVGDRTGLFPIAYLARAAYFNLPRDSPEWTVATRTAAEYVVPFTPTLPDGTFSRVTGWQGQPPGSQFLWCDDGFMGLALLARLARAGVPQAEAYAGTVATMQLHYSSHFQDPHSGLYFHGDNAATGSSSCCFWSRANGWQLMSAVEVLLAVTQVTPSSPLIPQLQAGFKSHADAMIAAQGADGRFHQVVNDSSTFLETSATAMATYALCTAVTQGWLPRAAYDPAIQRAWAGLAAQVQPDGSVNGICEGTGILASAQAYNARTTYYNASAPGIGSVLRAALAFAQYSQ